MVMAQPACQPVGLRRRSGEMKCGGVGKNAAANILDMHLPSDADAEIADLSCPCQAAKPVRLHLDPVTGISPPSVQMILQPVHAFIKHDWLRHPRFDMRTLVKRLAGLFHPFARGDAVQHADGGAGLPGAVHIKCDILTSRKGS